MKLVIGSALHGGTTFAYSVLRRLGLNMGHEVEVSELETLDGISSWRFSHLMERPDALVVHQVRNPLRSIRSILSFGLHRQHPDLFGPGDDSVRFACDCYVSEFRSMESLKPDMTHKIECPQWGEIMERLGKPRPSGVEIADAERKAWAHRKPRTRESLRWQDLTDEVVEIAHEQGYPVEALCHAT